MVLRSMSIAAMDEPIFINASDIDVRFPYAQKPVLQSVALTLQQGERVAIVGASGCGKTTLIHALLGIIPQLIHADVTGRIEWQGADHGAAHRLKQTWPLISFLSQASGPQLATLTAADEIAFPLQSRGLAIDDIEERVHAAFESPLLHGLSEDADTLTLSGGWRQRLALATCLSDPTPCLVLDEPFAHLDPDAIEQSIEALNRLRDTNRTLLIVEHRIDLLKGLVDRIILLNEHGQIIADGPATHCLAHEKLLQQAGVARSFQRTRKAPTNNQILLTARDITLKRNGLLLLQHGDITIHSGEILGLSGRNGVGKSSLALALAGILRFDKGALALAPQTQILLVPQNPDLFFTTGALEFEIERFGLSWDGFADHAARLGLKVQRRDHPFHFSQGEKRRLALAMAMPENDHSSRIIIMDEPQSGLDGRNLDALSQALLHLADKGHALFVIAHDQGWLQSISDRLYTLSDTALREERCS